MINPQVDRCCQSYYAQ